MAAEASNFVALLAGRHGDPFAWLGPHQVQGQRIVRCLQPGAIGVELLDRTGQVLCGMRPLHPHGLFEANLPPRRVLGDDLMLEIAKRSPRTVGNLFALRGMDRPALRKSGEDVVAAVQAGLAVPGQDLPALVAMVRHDDPPQIAILGQLLAILTSSLAAEHQIAGSMLATTAELQEFVRWRLGLSTFEPPLMTGWRGEILGQPLVELLEGKRYVHVIDAASANPLHITRF